jgi:hypothetical protein
LEKIVIITSIVKNRPKYQQQFEKKVPRFSLNFSATILFLTGRIPVCVFVDFVVERVVVRIVEGQSLLRVGNELLQDPDRFLQTLIFGVAENQASKEFCSVLLIIYGGDDSTIPRHHGKVNMIFFCKTITIHPGGIRSRDP